MTAADLLALPGPDEPPVPTPPGEFREVAGHRLFVRRTPATSAGAEPALYVHGLDGSSPNWTDLAYLLSRRLDGEAVDLPGFGRSEPARTATFTIDEHVRAVEALLEDRGAGPVHLIGNSMGGAISILLAARRPDLVCSLVLVSPALPDLVPRRTSEWRLGLMLVPGLNKLLARAAADVPPERRVEEVYRVCYADPSRVSPARRDEAVTELVARLANPWAAAASGRSMRSLIGRWLTRGPGSLWAQAARVDVPVLVVWGREDRLVGVRLADRCMRAFRDVEVVVFDDCGHVAMLERPVDTAGAVLRHLDRVAAVSAPTPPRA